MPKYYWDEQRRDWVEKPFSRQKARLTIIPDLIDYQSPLGTGTISGRVARREDLKRGGCREVDPGEFKFQVKNPRYLARMRNEQGKR